MKKKPSSEKRSREAVARGWGMREREKGVGKRGKLSFRRGVRAEDLM